MYSSCVFRVPVLSYSSSMKAFAEGERLEMPDVSSQQKEQGHPSRTVSLQ